MNALEIIFYVLAIISLIIALLLSNHGNSGGINPIAGNDIELFKKTKDRGIVKIMQFILFVLVFILIGIGIVIRIFFGDNAPSTPEGDSGSTTQSIINTIQYLI